MFEFKVSSLVKISIILKNEYNNSKILYTDISITQRFKENLQNQSICSSTIEKDMEITHMRMRLNSAYEIKLNIVQ